MQATDGVAAALPLTRAEMERLFVENLLSEVPEQIYFKDLHSRFLRVSKGQARVFGAASADEVIGNDESAIVAAVTGMARALGMKTVGEGIETDEQLSGLTGLGCDDGQGYLLARPAGPVQLRAALGLDES